MHTIRYRTPKYREWKRIYDLAYRKRTEQRRKQIVAKYFLQHKSKIRAWLNQYQNQWRKTLRGRIAMRLSNAMRRKRIRETKDGTVTRKAVEQLYYNQSGKCALCGANLSQVQMHLDHINPLVSGGIHAIKNVQWTCAKCNLAKHKTGMRCHPENLPHLRK